MWLPTGRACVAVTAVSLDGKKRSEARCYSPSRMLVQRKRFLRTQHGHQRCPAGSACRALTRTPPRAPRTRRAGHAAGAPHRLQGDGLRACHAPACGWPRLPQPNPMLAQARRTTTRTAPTWAAWPRRRSAAPRPPCRTPRPPARCRARSGGGEAASCACFAGKRVLRAVRWLAHSVMLAIGAAPWAAVAEAAGTRRTMPPCGPCPAARAEVGDARARAETPGSPDAARRPSSRSSGAADGARRGAAEGEAAHACVDGSHPLAASRRPGAAGLQRVCGADAVRPPAGRRDVPAAGVRRPPRPPRRRGQAASLHGVTGQSRSPFEHISSTAPTEAALSKHRRLCFAVREAGNEKSSRGALSHLARARPGRRASTCGTAWKPRSTPRGGGWTRARWRRCPGGLTLTLTQVGRQCGAASTERLRPRNPCGACTRRARLSPRQACVTAEQHAGCRGPVPDAPPQALTGGAGAQVRAGAHRGGCWGSAVCHGARRAAAPVQHWAGALQGLSRASFAAAPGGHMSSQHAAWCPRGVRASTVACLACKCKCVGASAARGACGQGAARAQVDACFAWVPLPGAMLGDEADAALRTAPRWAELEPEQASTRARQPAKHLCAGHPHKHATALALSESIPPLNCVATRCLTLQAARDSGERKPSW